MPELELSAEQHVIVVEAKARELCDSVKAATEAGVSDALLLPALLGVFREAGMLPDMDFGSLMGMFR